MRKSSLIFASLAATLVIGLANPAIAQESSDQSADAGDDPWGGDIVVSARRRDETAQETPVAMTVLNNALLERYAVTGIDSIASLTPGLYTGETSGSVGGSISLRGVGSGESQAFIDQAISVNVDGVQISTAQILRAAQMDLQQIEVLRGPQALFFGKNSPGGIISITTASPGDKAEVMVRGGYEFDANEWIVDATFSAPLGDNAGIRLAGHYADMDGFIDIISPVEIITPPNPAIRRAGIDAFPNRKELFLRGTLAFEPTDNLDINLKATYTDTRIKGSPSYFSDIVGCPYGLPQEAIVVASNCRNDGVTVTAKIPESTLALNPLLEPDGHRDNKQMLISGTINYQLSDTLKLTSVTGYYDIDEDLSSNGGYGLAASNVFTVRFRNRQVSEELRLASDFGGAFDFLVGGFFEDRKLFTETYIVVPTFGNFELPFESTNQQQKTYSVFGQAQVGFTDALELSVGGRYTHEVKDLLNYNIALATAGTPVLTKPMVNFVNDPNYPGPKRLTFNNFSPEVTLTYKPSDDLMLFASFKKGYKSGGFDGAYTAGAVLTKGVNAFEPEEVTGGEAGLKAYLADRQVTFNLTGYWYDYKNLQVSTYDTAARSFSTGNAAQSRVRGIETDMVFRPRSIPGLEIHAAAAYNDAQFKEFFAQCYKGQSQALGCDNDINPVTGFGNTQDLSGVQLRKAPKFTATFGGYYETPVASGLMASLSSDLSYSSKYNYGTDYQPFTIQNGFAKLDASVRLFREDKRWELALIGRNLTNMRSLVNGIDRTSTGGTFGTTAPTCTAISPTRAPSGCQTLPDVIGTASRGRSVTLQATFRY